MIYWWLRQDDGLTPAAKELTEEGMHTPLGRRVWAAAQWEADLDAGMTVTLDEIAADEHALMRVLRAERNRHQEDRIEEERRKSR